MKLNRRDFVIIKMKNNKNAIWLNEDLKKKLFLVKNFKGFKNINQVIYFIGKSKINEVLDEFKSHLENLNKSKNKNYVKNSKKEIKQDLNTLENTGYKYEFTDEEIKNNLNLNLSLISNEKGL